MSLLKEYRQGLKSIAVEEVLDLVFYRPLAFLVVKTVYPTPVTPNQLTLASMLLGILGGTSFAFGTPLSFIVGGVFYLLSNVLDCSDGQLARLKKCGTPVGRILDGTADYVSSVAAYVGIGIGYASASPHPVVMWIVTAFVGFSNALQSGLLDYYRNRYLDVTLNRSSVLVDGQQAFEDAYASLSSQKGHTMEKALIRIYLGYSAVQQRFTADRKVTGDALKVPPEVFEREQRLLMHLWTYLGPTTQWTFLILCALFNRLDVYFWGIAGVGNALAIILVIVQRKKDRPTNLHGV